jgi:large subunit ribosomal protein L36
MNTGALRLWCVHAKYDEHTKRKAPLMKVRNSLRSLKNRPGAQVVRRRGKVYVINRKDPRSKARQG